MPENMSADNPPSLALLVSGLLDDTQQLMRQETALVRREIKQEWDKTKDATALMAGGLTVFAVVALLASFTLVKLLQQFVLPNQEWACFAIVTAVFALGGSLLLAAGRARFHHVHLTLPQSTASLGQDVDAVSAAVVGGAPTNSLARQR